MLDDDIGLQLSYLQTEINPILRPQVVLGMKTTTSVVPLISAADVLVKAEAYSKYICHDGDLEVDKHGFDIHGEIEHLVKYLQGKTRNIITVIEMMYHWAEHHRFLVNKVFDILKLAKHYVNGARAFDSARDRQFIKDIIDVVYKSLNPEWKKLPYFVEAPVKLMTVIYGTKEDPLRHVFAVMFALTVFYHTTGRYYVKSVLEFFMSMGPKYDNYALRMHLIKSEIDINTAIFRLNRCSDFDPRWSIEINETLTSMLSYFRAKSAISSKFIVDIENMLRVYEPINASIRSTQCLKQLLKLLDTIVSASDIAECVPHDSRALVISNSNYKLFFRAAQKMKEEYEKSIYFSWCRCYSDQILRPASDVEEYMAKRKGTKDIDFNHWINKFGVVKFRFEFYYSSVINLELACDIDRLSNHFILPCCCCRCR